MTARGAGAAQQEACGRQGVLLLVASRPGRGRLARTGARCGVDSAAVRGRAQAGREAVEVGGAAAEESEGRVRRGVLHIGWRGEGTGSGKVAEGSRNEDPVQLCLVRRGWLVVAVGRWVGEVVVVVVAGRVGKERTRLCGRRLLKRASCPLSCADTPAARARPTRAIPVGIPVGIPAAIPAAIPARSGAQAHG